MAHTLSIGGWGTVVTGFAVVKLQNKQLFAEAISHKKFLNYEEYRRSENSKVNHTYSCIN